MRCAALREEAAPKTACPLLEAPRPRGMRCAAVSRECAPRTGGCARGGDPLLQGGYLCRSEWRLRRGSEPCARRRGPVLRGGDPVPRVGTFAQQRGDCTPEGGSCALQGESCARAWRPCILERGPVPSRREAAPGEETPCVTLKLRPDDGDPVPCRRDHVLGRGETAPRGGGTNAPQR